MSRSIWSLVESKTNQFGPIRFWISPAKWLVSAPPSITLSQQIGKPSLLLITRWLADLVREQVDICRANGWTYLFTDDGEPMYRDNESYSELGLSLPNTTKPESRFIKRYTMAHQFLADNQNDLVSLAQILGHENLNTTARYTKRTQDQLGDASERVAY